MTGWDPAEFPLDDDLVHLNHAGVAPWPRRCADAVARFAEVNAKRSYAGQFAGWMETEQRLRQRLAALINADGPDDIALVKNTSEGLSQVAHGLDWNAGDRVVALDEEFISNLIVWESLEVHGVDLQRVVPDGDASPESALEAACDARTRLMAVSSVQYGTGRRMDLERLGRFCRERDILFCVDAIQSLGALRFDAVACNADFVVSGGHKWMMSPFGVGLLWMRPALRDEVRPLAYGWHSVVDPMRFAGSLAEMDPSARRYEAGTANLAAIMGFEATLSLFDEVGPAAIESAVLQNAMFLAERLAAVDGVSVISPTDDAGRSGNVCVVVDGWSLAELATRLEDEYGVLCAARGPSLRFSPHFYTGTESLDRAVSALAGLVHGT